jgi:hypothetical protein
LSFDHLFGYSIILEASSRSRGFAEFQKKDEGACTDEMQLLRRYCEGDSKCFFLNAIEKYGSEEYPQKYAISDNDISV